MADAFDSDATIRAMRAGQVVFGRYELKRVLGRGGMGVVWLAHDRSLELDVALKFLPEVVAQDAEAVKDLKRETRRALKLTHPHIVRIYDFIEEGEKAAISMEYIEGRSLAQAKVEKEAGYFEVEEVGPWLEQLAGALDYAHGKAKIVHRDLKPANLLLTAEGEVKITDFGIAATLTDSVTRVSRTAGGGTSGSPNYMSPQQMMGEQPAVADDLYALGATLYELLTGKPPFYQGNVFVQAKEKLAPRMADRRGELEGGGEGGKGRVIPEGWEVVVAACLAKEAAGRPVSAGEVVRGLKGVAKAEVSRAVEAGSGVVLKDMWADELEPGAEVGAGKPQGERGVVDRGPGAEAGEGRVGKKGWVGVGVGLAGLLLLLVAGWWIFGRGAGEPEGDGASMPDRGGEPARPTNREEGPAPGGAEESSEVFLVEVNPPVAGTRVWLGPNEAVPVLVGRVALSRTPGGEQELRVEAPGHRTHVSRVAVTTRGGGRAVVSLIPLVAQAPVPEPVSAPAPAPVPVTTPAPGSDTVAALIGLTRARPQTGQVWTVPGIGLSLAALPAGSFEMGTRAGGKIDERPVTRVTLGRPFWMARREVTQAQWQTVMGEGIEALRDRGDPSWPLRGVDRDQPVYYVTWTEAMEFGVRLTAREREAGRLPEGYVYTLPTEAEWEYAARAGGSAGGELDGVAWYGLNSEGTTRPVGVKQENAWGLHDLLGNVSEWCRDYYGSYPGGAVTDPTGAVSGFNRVVRGGSWRSPVEEVRVAHRNWEAPHFRNSAVGFRVVLRLDNSD